MENIGVLNIKLVSQFSCFGMLLPSGNKFPCGKIAPNSCQKESPASECSTYDVQNGNYRARPRADACKASDFANIKENIKQNGKKEGVRIPRRTEMEDVL
ncbi:hypothetical protein KM043_012018 [Ampulex compressa]|nr:hypothetical protein KM043_012018 [Ampulex compressa]